MKKSLILKIIIGIIMVLAVFLIIVNMFNKNSKEITFYLIGEEELTLTLGDDYYELGFIAVDENGELLNEKVVIENLVDTEKSGIYTITYTLEEGNFKKKLERIVTVTPKESRYNLVLNGKETVEIMVGQEFIDDGCLVYDQNGHLVDIDVITEGTVDVNNVGSYTLKYVLDYEGEKIEIERIVLVYDLNYEYIKTNKDGQVILNFLINDDNYAYVKLPNGNMLTDKNFSYPITENGTYYFNFYDKFGNNKQEVIVIDNFVSDLVCRGVIDRYGTSLTIDGSDSSKFTSFEWYIDGEKHISGKNYNLAYKKVSKAYVIINNNGKNEQIECSLTNNLFYNFIYDANNTKPFMQCGTYSGQDKINLEAKLKNAVMQAGLKTRAGVVEAARFLVGGLAYKVPYLGPKTVNQDLGRYAKEGLNIGSNTSWGCSVSGWTQGMDCTNFVSWAFIQAGLQVKSIYGTQNVYPITEVVNQLKVGDLLLTPNDNTFSHVGIIIGIDANSIYVAEATTGNINAIVTTKLDKRNLPTTGKFSKARLYNYDNDGNLTSMWVD